MNAIFDKEGQFVCVIRNTEIAKARAQEFRGTYEAIEETPGSIPPEFITKTIPGAVIMRAGGVEWVRHKVEPVAQPIDPGPYLETDEKGGLRKKRPAKVEKTEEPAEVKDDAEVTAPPESGIVIEKD